MRNFPPITAALRHVASALSLDQGLVKQRYLLQEDAELLVREAEEKGVRSAP